MAAAFVCLEQEGERGVEGQGRGREGRWVLPDKRPGRFVFHREGHIRPSQLPKPTTSIQKNKHTHTHMRQSRARAHRPCQKTSPTTAPISQSILLSSQHLYSQSVGARVGQRRRRRRKKGFAFLDRATEAHCVPPTVRPTQKQGRGQEVARICAWQPSLPSTQQQALSFRVYSTC